jgi:hypothetical protein
MDIGPSSSKTTELRKSVIKFVQRCNAYVDTLSQIQIYCLWRYTIGSASINKKLIFGDIGENAPYWTYLFFKYAKSSDIRVDKPFNDYKEFFKNPDEFNNLSDESKSAISNGVITKYIILLQEIILNGPKVPKGGITVYKVASVYPDLPSLNPIEFKPKQVIQLPFNSTTISPHFNFAPFISNAGQSVLFDIYIPAGNKVLFIPTDLHAYRFEYEILLPFGCVFDIFKLQKTILDYIDPESVNIIQIQNKKDVNIGNVYDIATYSPCKTGYCKVQRKNMNIFKCVYYPPK